MTRKNHANENENYFDGLGRLRGAAFKLPLLVFGLAALCLAFSTAARADAIVISTFDADAEGWTAVSLSGTLVSAPVGVTWNATGGNPDGHISRSDFGSGTWYFNAPAPFLGDKSAAYNGSLFFDVKFTGTGGIFNAGDVRLTGTNGLTLVIDLPTFPEGPWTSFDVLLHESAGWRVGSITGAAATQDQMLSVLANLAGLRIRGEYIEGGDTGRLDNVSLNTEPVPEPATLALMGSGVAGVAYLVRRRRRATKMTLARRYECLRLEPGMKTSWNA